MIMKWLKKGKLLNEIAFNAVLMSELFVEETINYLLSSFFCCHSIACTSTYTSSPPETPINPKEFEQYCTQNLHTISFLYIFISILPIFSMCFNSRELKLLLLYILSSTILLTHIFYTQLNRVYH